MEQVGNWPLIPATTHSHTQTQTLRLLIPAQSAGPPATSHSRPAMPEYHAHRADKRCHPAQLSAKRVAPLDPLAISSRARSPSTLRPADQTASARHPIPTSEAHRVRETGAANTHFVLNHFLRACHFVRDQRGRRPGRGAARCAETIARANKYGCRSVPGISNFTRDPGMTFHVFTALEKSRADLFRRQIFEQPQTAFARTVVEGQRQRSPPPGPRSHLPHMQLSVHWIRKQLLISVARFVAETQTDE